MAAVAVNHVLDLMLTPDGKLYVVPAPAWRSCTIALDAALRARAPGMVMSLWSMNGAIWVGRRVWKAEDGKTAGFEDEANLAQAPACST